MALFSLSFLGVASVAVSASARCVCPRGQSCSRSCYHGSVCSLLGWLCSSFCSVVPLFLFFYSHRDELCCLSGSLEFSELCGRLSFAILMYLRRAWPFPRDVLGSQVAQQMQQPRRMREKSCNPGQKKLMLKEIYFLHVTRSQHGRNYVSQHNTESSGQKCTLESQADAPLRGRGRSWLSSRACFRDGCTGGFWRFRRCPEHLLLPSQAWTKHSHGPFSL